MEDIDKYIKAEIEQLNSSVSSDMWSRIESQLPAPEKEYKVIPFYYWTVGVLSLISILFGIYYFSNRTTSSYIDEDIVVGQFENLTKTKFNTKNITSNSLLSTSSLSSEKQDLGKNEGNTIVQDVINEDNNSTVSKNYLDNSSLKNSNANLSRVTNDNSFVDSSNESVNSTKKSRSQKKSFVSNSKISDINTQLGMNTRKEFSNTPIARYISDVKTANAKLGALDGIPVLSSNVYVKPIMESMNGFEHIIRDPFCPDTREGVDEHFFFEAHLNPLYNYFSFKSKSIEFDDYPKMRASSESTKFSYSLGFRVGFKNEKGYIFSTGLDFTQLNSRFIHIDSSSIKKTTIIDTIFYGDGTFEVNKRTIVIEGAKNVKANNYMTMLDIPLLFSYEIPVSSRSSFNITTGAFLNLSFAHETRIFNPLGEPQWASSSDDGDLNVYKNGLGISFYLSTGFNYQLSKKWHVLVMPNVRLYSEDFTIGSYPLSESHILFGLRTGVRYQF